MSLCSPYIRELASYTRSMQKCCNRRTEIRAVTEQIFRRMCSEDAHGIQEGDFNTYVTSTANLGPLRRQRYFCSSISKQRATLSRRADGPPRRQSTTFGGQATSVEYFQSHPKRIRDRGTSAMSLREIKFLRAISRFGEESMDHRQGKHTKVAVDKIGLRLCSTSAVQLAEVKLSTF